MTTDFKQQYSWSTSGNNEGLSELKTWTARKLIYREMKSNSPLIGAFLVAITSLAKRSNYTLEDDAGNPDFDFFRKVELENLISKLLEERVVYGFSLAEFTYANDFSHLTNFNAIPVTTIQEPLGNDFSVITQQLAYSARSPNIEIKIPTEKIVVIGNNRNVVPSILSQDSMLRTCYVPYYYISKLQEIEAIGMDRAMIGIPKFTVPPSMIEAGTVPHSTLANIADSMRVSENAYICLTADEYTGADDTIKKTGFTFELLTADLGAAAHIHTAIVRYEQRLAVALLSQFFLLGTESGSYALGETHTNLFKESLEGLLDEITSAIQNSLLKKHQELTGKQLWLRRSPIDSPTLSQLAAMLPQLVSAGLVSQELAAEKISEAL